MTRGSCLCGAVRYEMSGALPEAHILTASKAYWFDITDDLARFDEYPPQG